MNKTLHGLAAQYTSAMQDYLAMTGGICLESARELGCRALVAKASITDLIAIHQEALLALLCNVSDAGASENTRKRAAEFLTHTLLPYEYRHSKNVPNFPMLRSPSETTGAG